MLSTSIIKNTGQAGHYYSAQDNYYTKDQGIQKSEWFGKGAAKLNLKGEVNLKEFTNYLNGIVPTTGELLGKKVEGEIKHRAGWDLTFSAPKSVSILALLGGDTRLLEAHNQSVKAALSHIESSCAKTRVKVKDEVQCESTENIIASLFHHDLSRSKDPQLHTHAVVMNMTERSDGKWRSMASQFGKYNGNVEREINGFIERIRHNNRYYSKIYESELAFRIQELGYGITTNTPSGIFEIEGVPQEAIHLFSKRRKEIEAALTEKGMSGGKAAQIATLSTREEKGEIDRSILKEKWVQSVSNIGFDVNAVIEKSKISSKKVNYAPLRSIEEKLINTDEVSKAIEHAASSLSFFKTTFTLEDVVMETSEYMIKNQVGVDVILEKINDKTRNGDFISVPNTMGKSVLMSKATLDRERKLFECLKGSTLAKRLIDGSKIQHYIERNPTYLDQADNLYRVFNQDRAVLIEGKEAQSTLLQPIVEVAKKNGKRVIVLSPSVLSSKRISKEIKTKPNSFFEKLKTIFVDRSPRHYSITQFLSDNVQEYMDSLSPSLVLVHNAEQFSTEQMQRLVEWNQGNNSKLVLFGNKNAIESQKINISLGSLIKNGMPSITIEAKKGTVERKINEKEINSLFEKMNGRILHFPVFDDRHHAMADHFSMLNQERRSTSWLVAHKKENVHTLNRLTHEALVRNQSLKNEHPVSVLVPVYIKEGKAAQAKTYQINHVVRFNESYPSLKVKRGEYLRVIRHSTSSNRVLLQKENGDRVVWRPDRIAANQFGRVELFKEEIRTFSPYEQIIINRSLKPENLIKGERYFIMSMTNNKLKLADVDGKIVKLNLNDPSHRHIDYGYASTLHSIVSETPTQLIVDIPSKSFQANQRHFFQAISQSENVWIYTDDLKIFKENIQNRTGDRLSARETMVHANELNKSMNAFFDILQTEILKEKVTTNVKSVEAALDSMDYAIKHLSEREAGFTQEELMTVALDHAIGKLTEPFLKDVFSKMKQKGVLIEGKGDAGLLWTTAQAIKMEKEILVLSSQDKGKIQPVISEIESFQDDRLTPLRPEQQKAIKSILSSKDRVQTIEGRAGTGKTTMMTALSNILKNNVLLEDKGYLLHCIAPTHKAVKELKDRGLKAQTVDQFLMDMRQIQTNKESVNFSKTILVVDESSMIPNRNMLSVLRAGHEFDFLKILPVGDTQQNQAIEAGKPFSLIQGTLNDAAILKDIQRQKNPSLKQAAQHLYNKEVDLTFSALNDKIIEIGDDSLSEKHHQERIQTISKDYVSLYLEGESIKVISPSHVDRKAINEEVRNLLSEKRCLKGEERVFDIYASQNKTSVERSRATNFKIGDVLRFSSSGGTQIKSGDYCTIKKINLANNILTLFHHASQKEIVWEIPRSKERVNHSVETFKQESRSLSIGDQIIWTKTNNKENLLSTSCSLVLQVEKNSITIKQEDGNIMTFNPHESKYKHWDHAYAITVYGAQGGTYSTVLALFETRWKKLVNFRNFLVTITRPVNELRLYTDSKTKLMNSIKENTGEKLSALEISEPKRDGIQNQMLKENTIKKAPPSRSVSAFLNRQELAHLKNLLNKDAERIAITLLGEPKDRGSNYIKFGNNKGSLTLTTKGEKQGWFNDFETNKGGRDMLKFIEVHGGMIKKEAVQYALKWAGVITKTDQPMNQNPHQSAANSSLQNEQIKTDYEKKRIALANRIARESITIKGTLGEKYLKEFRGVDLKTALEDIRFHPSVYSGKNKKSLPALIAIARNGEGKVQAVEVIFLDPKTGNKADVPLTKQTIGSKKGAMVIVNQSQKPDAPTLIAEGVVTGLSLAKALPNTNVRITLGKQMFANINPDQLSKQVIFCLDNDGKNLKQDRLIHNAASRLLDKKDVRFMVPSGLDLKKQDYNDILKQKGVEAIQKDFQHSISHQEFFQSSQNISKIEPKKLQKLSQNLANQSEKNTKIDIQSYRKLSQDRIQIRAEKTLSDSISSSKPMCEIKNLDREI